MDPLETSISCDPLEPPSWQAKHATHALPNRMGETELWLRSVVGRISGSSEFPNSVSPKEIEARLARLKDIYAVCGGWNDLSNFLAPHIHKGVVPVPLPPKELSSILGVKFDGWVHWRTVLVSQLPSIPWEACRPIRAEGRVWPVLGGGFQTAVAGLRPGGRSLAGFGPWPAPRTCPPFPG